MVENYQAVTSGVPASAILVVEGLGDGLLEPVGLGYLASFGEHLDVSLRHDRRLLLDRVGFGHGFVMVHVAILPDNMRPFYGEAVVVIVDRPTRVVDREGGR